MKKSTVSARTIVAQDMGHQIVIATALLYVVPVLALVLCGQIWSYEHIYTGNRDLQTGAVLVFATVAAYAGWAVLRWSQNSTSRLAKYSREMLRGEIPTRISLESKNSDITVIEESMNNMLGLVEELRVDQAEMNAKYENVLQAIVSTADSALASGLSTKTALFENLLEIKSVAQGETREKQLEG